jgi:hypothetical protein
MTRAQQPGERDLHAAFSAWLAGGAADEPGRDLALHGAYCPECRAGMAALDLLQLIDTGRAPLPPSRQTVPRDRRRTAGLLLAGAASAGLLALVVAGWTLRPIPASLAAGSPSPVQEVLGGIGGGEPASAGPVQSDAAGESVDPTATAAPRTAGPSPLAQPAASPVPSDQFRTARPTETETPDRTRRPTGSPTPSETPQPTPTRIALPDDCENGLDDDGDTLIDLLDPGCLLDGNEASA